MSDVPGVGPPEGLPPQKPVQQVADPKGDIAINFFQNQYADQMAAIGKEEHLQKRKAW